MLVAYDKSNSKADRILKRHQVSSAFSDIENFEFLVRNQFLLGVHTAFSQEILSFLRGEVGPQQVIADILALKDRSSISQMLRSGTMDGIRLTAALYLFRHIITLPTQERAALHGFARATSFIKAQLHQDESIEGSMSPQEFSFLVGMLASDEWDDAIRDPDPSAARSIAVKIVDEREISIVNSERPRKLRPEQCVLMLQDIHETWGDCGVLALYIIPDCIPTNNSDREVTL